jgi:hypothetical protein
MTRAKGIRNSSSYRYRVTNAEGEQRLFISQPEIMHAYELKRTAVFYMLHQPSMRRDHRGLVIQLLEKPLPVYTRRRVESETGWAIVHELIIYPAARSPAPAPRRPAPRVCTRCTPSTAVSAGSETTAWCG